MRTALLSALLACGPGTSDSASDSASTTDTGTGSTSGSSGGSTPTTGDTSASTGDLCQPLRDDTSSIPVEIRLRNETASTYFFPAHGACTPDPFAIKPPSGSDPASPTVGGCTTCDGVLAGACECPGAPCQSVDFLMLAPGGEYRGTWSGFLYAATDLPAACSTACGDRCDRRVQAPAGTYAAESVFAGTIAEGCIDDMGQPAECNCTPNADGWCLIFGSGGDIVDTPLAVIVEFDYPDTTVVELIVT